MQNTRPTKESYTGRLAPSPTGLLHLGHVRTFSIAARRAQAANGQLLLRIDDLDPQRSRPAFTQAAMDDLLWLGLPWQGEPYLQSQQVGLYRAAWEKLVANGWVYPCCCSRRTVQGLGLQGTLLPEQDAEPIYPGTCRPRHPVTVAQRDQWLADGPAGYTWRFQLPTKTIDFTDGSLGQQSFAPGRDLGDFPVWRSDGIAAYQLASVVDDAALGITEVVRGADLLLSTARQLLLFTAFGYAVPTFFHCSLVLDALGKRLAKRTDALSVQAMRQRGLKAADVLALAHP